MSGKRTTGLTLLLVAASFACPASGHARDLSVCNATLIHSTYQSSDRRFLDWRLATAVSRDTFDTLKRGASGNATIYGVPMGANYDEFRENINRFKETRDESLTSEQVQNILWTGLSSNSLAAYEACLQAELRMADGLFLIPQGGNERQAVFAVRWRPPVGYSDKASLQWVGQPTGANLPREVTKGDTTVIIPRPAQSTTLAVNSRGLTDRVKLTALPPPPIQRPQRPCGGIVNASGGYVIAGDPRSSAFRINVPECGSFVLTGMWSNYVFGPGREGPIGPALAPQPQIVTVNMSLCIEQANDMGLNGGAMVIHIDRGCARPGEPSLPSARVFYRRWPTANFIDREVSNLATLLPEIEKRRQ